MVAINCMSCKNTEVYVMHSKSDNVEFMINDRAG